MEIRKASVQDLGQIMQVYDKARKFMRENGNAEQWGEDYPSAELIEHDIDKMYLCMSEGQIACVFYYAAEADEDYKEFSLSDWNQVLEGSKSQHKLSKNVLLDMFWDVACTGWSDRTIYTNILSKSLDYCIPF